MEIRNKIYYLRLFVVGMVMGIANIIPGVSGGTMAVVFGIYEELMEALAKFITDKENRFKHILFLVILFAGTLLAILIFSKALSWAFDNYELMTVNFFIGLIIGSIPVVVKSHHDMKLNRGRSISFLLGMSIVIILALFQHGSGTHSQAFDYTQYGILHYLYFGICGIIAASAMIIPGVSGSFILILLGVYRTVLDSISGISGLLLEQGINPEAKVRIMIIGSLGVGVVIGILGFARLMSWALKTQPAITMYFILGLLIGSIYQIYPGFSFNIMGLGSVLTFAFGLVLSLQFGKQNKDTT